MKKEKYWTIAIIVGIIILSYFVLNKPHPQTSEEIAKCIGENAVLYVQLGCSHCKDQENLFGENYELINSVDCFFEKDKCIQEQISATPTWIIKEQKITGVQTIAKLQELTGC